MKVDNCSLHNNVKAQVNYKPPQREPDSRVCLHLKDIANKKHVPNTAFCGHGQVWQVGLPEPRAPELLQGASRDTPSQNGG